MTQPDNPWITIQEIAAELRLSNMSIYRLVSDGELPATKVGRSIRIRRTDLDEYLARNATTKKKETP